MTRKKEASELKKRGRKPAYNPDIHPQLCQILAKEGKTNEEMAKRCGVSVEAFRKWQHKYPELVAPIKIGKEYADDEVIQSLFNRARGYKFTEKRVVQIGDERTEIDGEGKEWRVKAVRKEMTEKEIAPDPTSMIFWLKNRRPKDWRDKHEQVLSGADGKPIKIEWETVGK